MESRRVNKENTSSNVMFFLLDSSKLPVQITDRQSHKAEDNSSLHFFLLIVTHNHNTNTHSFKINVDGDF